MERLSIILFLATYFWVGVYVQSLYIFEDRIFRVRRTGTEYGLIIMFWPIFLVMYLIKNINK